MTTSRLILASLLALDIIIIALCSANKLATNSTENLPQHQLLETRAGPNDQSCSSHQLIGAQNFLQGCLFGANKHNDSLLANKHLTSLRSAFNHRHPDEIELQEYLDLVEEPYVWRLKYLDEQVTEGFQVKFPESSLDERLANIIYTVRSVKLFNGDNSLFNVGDPEKVSQFEFQAADSRVDDHLCGQQLAEIIALLEETSALVDQKRLPVDGGAEVGSAKFAERHIKLAHFLDSFGHYDAGLLSGRLQFLGSYNQCKRSHLELGRDSKPVATRYCVGRLASVKHLDPRLRLRHKPETEESSVLDLGMCLPASCHSKSFHSQRHLMQQLANTQFRLPRELFIEENLELESVFCEIEGDSQLAAIPPSGRLLIGLLTFWLLATVTCTLRGRKLIALLEDKNNPKSRTRKFVNKWLGHLIKCLNLKSSWDSFIESNPNATKHDTQTLNLDVMNPIKVFSSFIVVLGHSFMVASTINADLPWAYNSSESDPILALMLNATLVTDTFYVITGILVTFISMKKLNKYYQKGSQEEEEAGLLAKAWKFAKHSFQIMITRYLRLVPLYGLVFWFHKSLFVLMGSGPMWDQAYNRNTLAGACRQESWLTPFTFAAAYRPLARQCMPHSWSISGDIFFAIILAPLIVTLFQRPKLAGIISIALSCLSSTTMYVQIASVGGSLRQSMAQLEYRAFVLIFANSSQLYTAPHFRVFSVLIGALAGYTLFKWSQTKRDPWRGQLAGAPTKVSAYFICIMVLLPSLVVMLKSNFLKWVPLNEYLIDASVTIGRLFWALSNAILIVRMATEWKERELMRNFAGSFWRIMAKLCYTVLLLHVAVIYYDILSVLSVPFFTRYSILKMGLLSYIMTLMLALPLHLIVENPIDKFVKGALNGLEQATPATCGRQEREKQEELKQQVVSTNNNHHNEPLIESGRPLAGRGELCTRC